MWNWEYLLWLQYDIKSHTFARGCHATIFVDVNANHRRSSLSPFAIAWKIKYELIFQCSPKSRMCSFFSQFSLALRYTAHQIYLDSMLCVYECARLRPNCISCKTQHTYLVVPDLQKQAKARVFLFLFTFVTSTTLYSASNISRQHVVCIWMR
jgi:hypothetical protein